MMHIVMVIMTVLKRFIIKMALIEQHFDIDSHFFRCNKCTIGVDMHDNYCRNCGEEFTGVIDKSVYN